MDQKVIISSLAMDLKRVAIGLHRGSFTMANRFREEAIKRGQELKKQKTDGYIIKLVEKMNKSFSKSNEDLAEDALMLSTLFQNYVLKKL